MPISPPRTSRETICRCRPGRRTGSPSARVSSSPRASSSASSRSRCFAASWPIDGVELPLRLDELEQPLALALDQPLLELAEDAASRAAARRRARTATSTSRSLSDMPALSVRELLRACSRRRRASSRPAFDRVRRRAGTPARSGSLGSGTSIVATCGLPVTRSLTSLRRSSISTNAMFEALDVRARRPVEQRHEHARRGEARAAGLAGREQERRLVDEHRDAEPLLRRRHDVFAHEQIEQPERRSPDRSSPSTGRRCGASPARPSP